MGRCPGAGDGGSFVKPKNILELTSPFLSRQLQVLLLWLLRFSYKEIAAAMCVTSNTVNSHLARLVEYYGVDSLPELHRVALPEMHSFLSMCSEKSLYTDKQNHGNIIIDGGPYD